MTTSKRTPEAGEGIHPKRWFELTTLGTAQFMLVLDVTAVAIALPQMGAELALFA